METQNVLAQIKKTRMSLGYSQEYMSYQLNMSQNHYCKIENGQIRLSADTMFRIAGVLKIQITLTR